MNPAEQTALELIGRTIARTAPATWPEAIDGAAVLDAATMHGVGPLFYDALVQSGRLDRIPRQVAEALRDQARELAALDLVRGRELLALERRLAERGVPVILLKGAALARTHYVHGGMRPRCDDDLLVRRTDVARAEAVLAESGYSEELNSGGELASTQRMWLKVDGFGIRHVVDLHWELSNRPRFARAFPFDDVWARSMPVPGLAHARCAPPAEALLLACVHLAAHHHDLERLIWYYDIHVLVRALDERDIAALAGRIRANSFGGVVRHALAATQRWLGTEIPPALLIEGGRFEPLSLYRQLRDDLRCTPRLGQKLRLLREHAVPPPSYMMARFGARSRALLPALYMRRAARAAMRMLLRAR